MKKWFVNLPPKKGEPFGKDLHLKATRSFASNRKGGRRDVEWSVDAVDDTTGAVSPVSQDAAAACRFKSGTYTTDVNGVFQNTLELPPIGGVRYTIRCRKRAGDRKVKSTAQYVSWRRVFCTVYTMNDVCKKVADKVVPRLKEALEASYVELVKLRRVDTLQDDGARGTLSSRVSHLYHAPDQRNGPHLALIFLDHFYDTREQKFEVPITSADVEDGPSGKRIVTFEVPQQVTDPIQADWPKSLPCQSKFRDEPFGRSDAKAAVVAEDGKSATLELTDQLEHHLSEDGAASIRVDVTGTDDKRTSLPVRIKGDAIVETSNGIEASFSKPRKELTLRFDALTAKSIWTVTEYSYGSETSNSERNVRRVSDRKVSVEIEGGLAKALAAGRDAKLIWNLTFDAASNVAAFVEINQPFAAMSTFGEDDTLSLDDRAEKVFHALLHEIGHQLDLSNASLATYYTQHGGQGPHCKKNCAPIAVGPGTAYPNLPAGQIMNPTAPGVDVCVMFHAIGHRGKRMGRFCETCGPGAQRADLSKIPV